MARITSRAAELPDQGTLLSMIPVCKVADIPADAGLRVELPGHAPVAVFHIEGAYFVIDDLCTHGEASLADGELDGLEIICPYHMGSFDLRTGEPVAAPCTIPVKTYASELRGDTLYALITPR